MAGTSIRIDDKDVRNALKNVLDRVGNLAPVMKAFGEHMMLTTEERFSAEKAPDGSAWKPLSPLTRLIKKNDKILTESSQLRASIIYTADKSRMAYGTNKIYGAIHQFGGQAGRGKKVTIPARPFLGFNDDDIVELVETAKDYLKLQA